MSDYMDLFERRSWQEEEEIYALPNSSAITICRKVVLMSAIFLM